jgi:ketosteroid isomerase-like protein
MKNKMKFPIFLTLIAMGILAFTSCKEAPSTETEEVALDMEAIRAEIQAMEDAYAVAYSAGDASAVMSYYADDAVSMPANEPSAVGKAAIMASIQKSIDERKSPTTQAYEVVDLYAEGDLLVETGKSTTKDSTGTVISTGKYMSIFKKVDGKYICIRDISNGDMKME